MPLMAKQCFFNKTLMYDVIVSITKNLFYIKWFIKATHIQFLYYQIFVNQIVSIIIYQTPVFSCYHDRLRTVHFEVFLCTRDNRTVLHPYLFH